MKPKPFGYPSQNEARVLAVLFFKTRGFGVSGLRVDTVHEFVHRVGFLDGDYEKWTPARNTVRDHLRRLVVKGLATVEFTGSSHTARYAPTA